MTIIRKENEKYAYYEHSPSGNLVAVGMDDAKKISNLYKKHKKAELIDQSEKVKGYVFILDSEFNSLKIDFSNSVELCVNELVKASIK